MNLEIVDAVPSILDKTSSFNGNCRQSKQKPSVNVNIINILK